MQVYKIIREIILRQSKNPYGRKAIGIEIYYLNFNV